MGTFFYVILDVYLNITNSMFMNGIAKYGGAIYISGKSYVYIKAS